MGSGRSRRSLPLEHPPPDDGRPLERDEEQAVHPKPQEPDDRRPGSLSDRRILNYAVPQKYPHAYSDDAMGPARTQASSNGSECSNRRQEVGVVTKYTGS
jgi:hypothetical protein